MRKLIFIVIYFIFCIDLYCQNIIDNLDMFLSHKYIESTDGLYIYIEISIWNRNIENLFILKNYNIKNIVEEEDGIIIYLSSWIDNLDFIKNTSAMYHNPQMIEFRNRQHVYLPLLLKIPENIINIDVDKNIKEIIGLKYSLQEYITQDISWADNVDEFALGIKSKINELNFIYNKYNRKYGNLWISPLQPPYWIMGTWVIEEYYQDNEIDDIDCVIFQNDDIIYYGWSQNEYFFMSIFDRMTQNIYENHYEIKIEENNGRINIIKFTLEEEHLLIFMTDGNEIEEGILLKVN